MDNGTLAFYTKIQIYSSSYRKGHEVDYPKYKIHRNCTFYTNNAGQKSTYAIEIPV